MPSTDRSADGSTVRESRGSRTSTRRNALRLLLTGSAVALAGCSGEEPDDDDEDENRSTDTERDVDDTGTPTQATQSEDDEETPTDQESATRAAWRGTLGGPGNTCVGSDGLASDPEVAWTFDTGEFGPRSPTVADGRVHVVGEQYDSETGSYVTKAVALSAASGDVEWEQVLDEDGSIPEPVTSAPTVVDGTVYVVTSSQYSDGRAFVALDGASGEVLWELTGAAGDHFGGPVPSEGGVVEMASGTADGDFALRSYDGSGSERWSNPLGDLAPNVNGLAGGEGTVVVGGSGPYDDAPSLVAVDAASGETRWSVASAEFDAIPRLPPVVHDGSVYVATGLGPLGTTSGSSFHLHSFALSDGSLDWRTELRTETGDTAVPQGPFAVTDESLLALQREDSRSGDCEVVRYGAGDGDVVSRMGVGPASSSFSGVTAGGGVAYVPSAEGLSVVDTNEGARPMTEGLSLSPTYLENWGMPLVGGRALLVEDSRIVALA